MKKLLLVLLGVVSLGAWGQASAIEYKSFTTDKGCEISLEVDGFKERKHTWTGECRDGKVWGRGVLTYETNLGYGKGWEARWADVGQFNMEGRKFGTWMVINRKDKLIGYATYENGMNTGRRFLSQAKKPETIEGARAYLDEWTKGRTEALIPFIWMATKTYFEDSANFYLGEFAKNNVASNTNAAKDTSQIVGTDDPKVFGRSAVSNEEALRKAEELRQANEQREANLRRNQENQARIAREKEEREARELKELTDTLQQLSNSLGNLRRK